MIGLYLKDHLKLYSKDRKGEIHLSCTDAEVLKEMESLIAMDTRKEGISEDEFLDGLDEFYDRMRMVLYQYRKQKESRVEESEFRQVVVERVEAVRAKEPVMVERPVEVAMDIKQEEVEEPQVFDINILKDDILLSVKEVSRRLGCDPSYVYKEHIKLGGLKYGYATTKARKSGIGKKVLESELNRYMKEIMTAA